MASLEVFVSWSLESRVKSWTALELSLGAPIAFLLEWCFVDQVVTVHLDEEIGLEADFVAFLAPFAS